VTPQAERDEGDDGHGRENLLPELVDRSRQILQEAWRDEGPGRGFCVPHATTYPWQWLWDSCFHAIVWTHLGDERGLVELRTALSDQDADGFVAHLRYGDGPNPHTEFWGRPRTSSITQPPMYGHALAVLAAEGLAPDEELVERATAGLRFLLDRRRRSSGGLVELCHPWESGCDDSPRWDDALTEPWSAPRWRDRKGDLLTTIERLPGGAPVGNPGFAVGSVSFSALVAFNGRELADLTGDDHLRSAVTELTDAIDARWDRELRTWVDDGPADHRSGRVRTADALLPLLVIDRPEARAELVDPAALGAPYGPCGVHRDEPTFAPTTYWRGPAWPQLTYLLWWASKWAGDGSTRASLQNSLEAAVARSNFAEYWDPDSGAGLGAIPQSWSTLVAALVGD
jgi:hypothetical protein